MIIDWVATVYHAGLPVIEDLEFEALIEIEDEVLEVKEIYLGKGEFLVPDKSDMTFIVNQLASNLEDGIAGDPTIFQRVAESDGWRYTGLGGNDPDGKWVRVDGPRGR